MESSFQTQSELLGKAAAGCGLICLGDSLDDPKALVAFITRLDSMLSNLSPLPALLGPLKQAAVKSGRGPVAFRGERELCLHAAVLAGVKTFRDELDATADLEAFTLARLSRKRLAPTIIAQNWPAVRKWLKDNPGMVEDFQGVGALLEGERIAYADAMQPAVTEPVAGGQGDAPKPSCNTAMLELLQTKSEAHGWSIREWKEATGFELATIQATPTWAKLNEMKEQSRLDCARGSSARKGRVNRKPQTPEH